VSTKGSCLVDVVGWEDGWFTTMKMKIRDYHP